MSKVVKIKKPEAYKIEGEAFNRLREALKHRDALLDNLQKKLHERHKQIHEEFWEAVYKETGELGENNHYFNTDYEKLGLYIVEKHKCNSIFDLSD